MLQNNKKATIRSLINLFVRYPASFIKQVNVENFKTLKRAIINEPSSQIIGNVKKLLIKTNKDSIDGVYKKIDTFVSKIQNPHNKKVCLFISHESTLTGAPLIILNISKFFSEKYDFLPINILCLGGEMNETFREHGDTYVLDFYHNRVLLNREVSHLIAELKRRFDIAYTFVNSEGSTRLLPYLSKGGVGKIVTLIHEMGNYYPKGSWKHIDRMSDAVIFPAQYVKDRALENTDFDQDKVFVLGQGLLKPELLEETAEDYHLQIRKELKIPKESKIILGCGQLIPRKGLDIFIFIAISILNRISKQIPVYFIWLGEADFNDHQIWANRDILYSGHKDRIRFIGSKKNTIPYFRGSDIFLLTSRGDPFPCVVHEAMAGGMPVIGFKNAGGVPEMIDNKRGYLADYGDIYAASNRVLKYLDEPSFLKSHKRNAKTYALQQLNFENYIDDLHKIVEPFID